VLALISERVAPALISIAIPAAVYLPFAKAAERQRLKEVPDVAL
jgi:cellobiose-specific phosphotransferase system component IIC